MARIYLAGAMGCYEKNDEYPYEWRRKISHEDSINADFFNPTLYYNFRDKQQKTEKEVFRYEINELKQCDLVVVNLKDIDKSIGTVCELMCAFNYDIPVIGFLEEGNVEDLHPWIQEICLRIETGEDALSKTMGYISWYF